MFLACHTWAFAQEMRGDAIEQVHSASTRLFHRHLGCTIRSSWDEEMGPKLQLSSTHQIAASELLNSSHPPHIKNTLNRSKWLHIWVNALSNHGFCGTDCFFKGPISCQGAVSQATHGSSDVTEIWDSTCVCWLWSRLSSNLPHPKTCVHT